MKGHICREGEWGYLPVSFAERFGLGQNFVSSSKQLDQQHSTQAEVLSIKKDPVKHMDYWLKQSKYMTPSIINRWVSLKHGHQWIIDEFVWYFESLKLVFCSPAPLMRET